MIITITVADDADIDGIKAAGARDLCEHFFPSIGIKAASVKVHEITPENMAKRRKGDEYAYYLDAYPNADLIFEADE